MFSHFSLIGLLLFVSLGARAQTSAPSSAPATPVPQSPQPGAPEGQPLVSEPLGAAPVEGSLEKRLRFGVWGAINLAGNLSFGKVRFDTGAQSTDSANLNFKDSPSATLGLEVMYGAPNAWGLSAGASYDSNHRFRAYEFSSTYGRPASLTFGDFDANIFTIYANAIYRWDNFYIPFGLNISGIKVIDAPATVDNLKGGAGAQFGVGYFFGEGIMGEFILRGTAVNSESRDMNGTRLELGVGSVGTAQVVLKYYFL
jgi:hypothetical protein